MIKHYKIGKQIGSGTYGKVKAAYNLTTSKKRALKIIPKSLLRRSKEKGVHTELEILSLTDHPNIIKIYEYFEDKINYYLILELAQGESLFSFISKQRHLAEEQAKRILLQLISAVNYLHNRDILHRDLKTENIMVENEDLSVKLLDFGAGVFLNKGKKLKDIVGSYHYIAPEVLKESYDFKCDLWSIGVIMFLMLFGYPPFRGNSPSQIKQGISEYSIDFSGLGCSEDARSLLKGLLERDARSRFSAEEALDHRWFKGLKQMEIPKWEMENIVRNLKDFSSVDPGEYVRLSYSIRHCNIANEKVLRDVFILMDRSRNACVSYKDFCNAFEGFFLHVDGIGNEEFTRDVFNSIDRDSKGFFTYEEFLISAFDRNILLSKQTNTYVNSILERISSKCLTKRKSLMKLIPSETSTKPYRTISIKSL